MSINECYIRKAYTYIQQTVIDTMEACMCPYIYRTTNGNRHRQSYVITCYSGEKGKGGRTNVAAQIKKNKCEELL